MTKMSEQRTFKVTGPLKGYSVQAGMYHDPKWKAFKTHVRVLANLAGVPAEATETTEVHVNVFWRLKARIDGKNILAGIEDALFKKDRICAAGSWRRVRNAGEEYAVVTVIF
jgi:hypothetical protein